MRVTQKYLNGLSVLVAFGRDMLSLACRMTHRDTSRAYMSPKQAANYLGLTPLNEWRSECKGQPFAKPGRPVKYIREDLDEWMRAQRVHSTSETRGNRLAAREAVVSDSRKY